MRVLLLLSTMLIPGSVLAQISAEIPPPSQTSQGDVSVTIYNNNLALVQDTRQLAINPGRNRLEFPDVSAQIRSETVTLTGQGFGIVEQNFDFDLLSPQALMQKAVGETVTLVRTNPATGAEMRERARVLAANGGVVLQIGERIEVLRDDGLPVRVIFDRVPENLRARPTLSVTVQGQSAGRRPVTLTYLTPGLGWSADYVALFDDTAGRIDVQGWITLTNNSGTPYVNANTLLVAGAVAQANQGSYGRIRYSSPQPAGTLRQAGTESADRERLGDFYLYPLPERTTIANRQTKQVSFLDVNGAPAVRTYEFHNGWLGTQTEAQSASTVLGFSTSRDQGLGDALPAGVIRVYQRDARGTPQFIGESRIGHTPMGSEIGLTTGQAFDVKVQPVLVDRHEITEEKWRETARYRIVTADGAVATATREEPRERHYWQTEMRYTVTNARPQPVTVNVHQGGLDNGWQDTRIISETARSERLSSEQVLWRVQVPANGTTVLNVTIQTRY